MTNQYLKILFPYKNNTELMLPIEVSMMNSNDFSKSVKGIIDNFPMFVSKIIGENPDLDIETDLDKCKFQKVLVEEIDINNL